MRTITDVRTEVRKVDVVITPGELAARLGYTGLEVMGLQRDVDDGSIIISMQGGDYKRKDLDIGQEQEVRSRMHECCTKKSSVPFYYEEVVNESGDEIS